MHVLNAGFVSCDVLGSRFLRRPRDRHWQPSAHRIASPTIERDHNRSYDVVMTLRFHQMAPVKNLSQIVRDRPPPIRIIKSAAWIIGHRCHPNPNSPATVAPLHRASVLGLRMARLRQAFSKESKGLKT